MIIDWSDLNDIQVEPGLGCEAYEVGKELGVFKSISVATLGEMSDWYEFLGYPIYRKRNAKS